MHSLTLLAVVLAQPRFTEVADAVGIAHVQHRARESPECLYANGHFCEPERMSGAVAVGDYDGDGADDLYFTVLDGRDRLYRNEGGRFVDRSLEVGLGAMVASNGAAWADVDRDGDLDLYVTSLATLGYHLYVNEDGRFTEEAAARGADLASDQPHFGWSVGVGDYDRDGWVDLVVGEWFAAFVVNGEPRSHVAVLRNRGAEAPGHFEIAHDVETLGLHLLNNDGVWAFAPSFVDLDDDGWPDLLVASDFATSRLFWNDGQGGFVDGTEAAGVGTDENGMGSTVGDFDGDGRLDWFVSSIFDVDESCDVERCGWRHSGNRLYRNLGGRRFEDATDQAGVRDGEWGWGAVFFDADNDGDQDLTMTNGVDFPGGAADGPFNADSMRFWRNDDGVMVSMAFEAGLRDTGSGKAVATLDFDGDGDLDLVITRNADTPLVYRNDTVNENDWLRVRLRGRASNRDGVGARLTLRPSAGGAEQVRAMTAQSYFLSQSERVAHFGLGPDVPLVDVTVRWPTGESETVRCLATGRQLLWTEGDPPPEGPNCPAQPDAGPPEADAAPIDLDAGRPDMESLDAGAPDAPPPDALIPDVAPPDIAPPDVASPDIARPDTASPDVARPDAASPDVARPDVASSDMPAPDVAPVDLSVVPDAGDAHLEVDTLEPDVGSVDVGADSPLDAADDARVGDRALLADVGPREVAGGGCGCRSGSGPGALGWLLLLALRRRRALHSEVRR